MSAELAIVEQPRYYRDYSPEFKAEALALVKANDDNVYRTARELGIPEPTLRDWWMVKERYAAFQEQKQTELAVKLEYSAHSLTDSIAAHDLTDVPLGQKAVALGVVIDKLQLLRGQPTSITATVAVDDLHDLQQAAQSLAQQQQMSVYDACLRLAAELSDVPELATRLREWAQQQAEHKE